MDLIDMMVGIGWAVLAWIGILAGLAILTLLLLTAYNMMQHIRISKAEEKVENAMMKILAEFDAAIDSCNTADQKQVLDRYTKLRADFEQIMAAYYSNPNNNRSVH